MSAAKRTLSLETSAWLKGLVPFRLPCRQQPHGAGYDAMVQLSEAAMLAGLRRDLVGRALVSERDADALRAEERDAAVVAVAAEHVEAPVIAWPIAPRQVRVELELHSVAVRLSLAAVRVTSGATPQATLTLSARVVATARETAASYASRVDRASFNRAPEPFRGRVPAGADPIEHEVLLGTGQVQAVAPLALAVDPGEYWAEARFPSAEATVTVSGGTSAFTTLLQTESEAMVAEWGRVAIGARAEFFGGVSTPPPGITRFEARAIGTTVAGRSWLTLCFIMTPGDTAPSTTAIEPFTDGRTAAVFMTETVVTATVLVRWATIPRRAVELRVPLRLVGNDGDVVQGVARVRYSVGPASSASFRYGSDAIPDNVGIEAVIESRALSAELDGEDITSELGELASPRSEAQLFRAFSETSGVEQRLPELAAWLSGIGRHVMAPALRPLAAPWRLERFTASISTPLSSLICQGDIS